MAISYQCDCCKKMYLFEEGHPLILFGKSQLENNYANGRTVSCLPECQPLNWVDLCDSCAEKIRQFMRSLEGDYILIAREDLPDIMKEEVDKT